MQDRQVVASEELEEFVVVAPFRPIEIGNLDWSIGHGMPQLTAFFTSAAILASSAAVRSFRANEVGHIAPSSRCAASSNPSVAYLELNFSALLKKHTILPSLA